MKSLAVPILLLAAAYSQTVPNLPQNIAPKLAANAPVTQLPNVSPGTDANIASKTPANAAPKLKTVTSSFGTISCKPSDRLADCDKVPYNAVCGKKADKKLASYVSGCIACKDPNVVGYMDRECPAFNIDHLKGGKTEYTCKNQDRDVKCEMKPDVVCATLNDGSLKSFPNSCSACWQSDVLKIKKGQCPQNKVTYNYGLCSTKESRGLKCRVGKTTVCGFPDTDVPAEFDSPCWACKQWGVVGYLTGKCEDKLKKCPQKRVACQKASEAVKGCVFEQGKKAKQVEDARCCTGTTHSSYLIGNCPSSLPALSSKQRKCWDQFFPKTCPQEQKVVCATKTDGTKLTVKNECIACVDENAYSSIDGSCPK